MRIWCATTKLFIFGSIVARRIIRSTQLIIRSLLTFYASRFVGALNPRSITYNDGMQLNTLLQQPKIRDK